jgi:hypothetical protein
VLDLDTAHLSPSRGAIPGIGDTEQKALLNKVSVWKPQNFPNGSAYSKQVLVPSIGTKTEPIVVEHPSIAGWQVSFDNGKTFETVVKDYISVGKGADLGKHYNSRDQGLRLLND